ncbi:hypothetical protein BUALT_Bualt05G0105300 [Buddleja alternifolia]|uniref:Myb/SANT-like domain-containing protein n=1 Tax=Buddleja alternifolia TaxID=168488 RepID=A0AAV6XI52_9LAMI|nr:hypothetical protein BUALT_Bualt05G0105300 [Buddleja alternifolia]
MHFNNVLSALLKLHTLFLVKPVPIEDDCTNERWKRFKVCLGALDGTYIPLRVAQKDKGRYRNKKGDFSTNVLVVCDINMNYVYLLCGWEGSTADIRVLKDAITSQKGFRVPNGNYYLCDAGTQMGKVSLHLTAVLDTLFKNEIHKGLPHEMMNKMKGAVATESTGKASRKGWTAAEEKTLANALKDLVVMGYKADNGFKSGYQNLLEQAMKQAFPGTTLRAEPHINSRIHIWRKNYGSLSTMQSKSGFGWNRTTNTITVECEDVWTNYIKDRATGENVEGFPDVVQQILNENSNVVGGDYVPTFDNEQIDEVQSMSFTEANTSGSSKSEKRKRKVVDENDDRFIDLMSSFCDKTDEKLGAISRRIGFEHDSSLSTKSVFEAIGQVASLEMEEMISLSHLVVNNTKNMDLFFSLPNSGKKTMVKMIVEGRFLEKETIG